MPSTEVYFYKEIDDTAPALQWLDGIANNPRDKMIYRIQRLEQAGHELRRPEADYLRDGIYELRVRSQRVNYRLLYFFHGGAAIIAHGCTKESGVDSRDIDRAVGRKGLYEKNPKLHRLLMPEPD